MIKLTWQGEIFEYQYDWLFRFCFFFVFVFGTLCRALQPQCLGSLVTYFSQSVDTPADERIPKNDAYLFAGGIVFCSAGAILFTQPFFLMMMELGLRIRQSSCSLIYRKVRIYLLWPIGHRLNGHWLNLLQTMKLTKSVNIDGLNGEVLNLMTGDTAKFDYVCAYVYDLWRGPLECTVFGYFLYQEIGYYGFIGIGFILSFIPLQSNNAIKYHDVYW